MQKLRVKKKSKKPKKQKKKNPLLELLFNLFKEVAPEDLKKEFKTLRIILESKENEVKIRFEEEDEIKKIIKKGKEFLLREEKKKKKFSRTYVFHSQPVEVIPPEKVNYSTPKVEVKNPIPIVGESIPIPRSEEMNSLETLDSLMIEEEIPIYTPEIREDQFQYEEEFNPLSELKENENYLLIPDFNDENLSLPPQARLRESVERIIRYTPEIFEKFKQKIYKRILIRNPLKEATVYEALLASGLPMKIKYDRKFDAFYVISINGISEDPSRGSYWEFYINGEIGKSSIDKARVREGDIIEWRLGTSVCGYAA